MAAGDPPVLPDPAALQATNDGIAATGTTAATSADSLNTYNNAGSQVQSTLKKMAESAGLLVPALLGVSDAASKFAATAGAGRINTFSNQLDEISKAASRPGVAIEALKKAGSGLIDLLGRIGGGTAKTTSIMGQLSEAIATGSKDIGGIISMAASYAKNFVAMGDEMKVVREATLAQAAASGDLNVVLTMAGQNMQNLDRIAQRQQQMWVNAAKATGLSRAEVAAFSAEMNKVPGVLAQTTRNLEGHNKSNKEFIDTLKLFKISGRDYQAITQDMATAVKSFGVSQRGAVDYTTRMSVVAKELQIPINDLHAAITSSADAFRMFTTEGKAGDEMTKNLELSMAGYIRTLREAGIPQRNAVEMAQHFAGAMNEMGLAQKAFLSGMTGGPGGLMGAFQIEKMLDEGKIDQVFGKVQSALRKQFGRVVTTEEASRSQAAAEQMTRQMMILRQGPLGAFAKSDAEARRLLDSMAKGKRPEDAIKDLKKEEAGGSMERFLQQGNKIAQGSQGTLNEILVTLSEAEFAGAAGAARVTEPVLGARTYFRPGEGVGVPEAMARRREFAATGERPGGATLIESTMRDMKNLPNSIKDAMKSLGVALQSGNKETVDAAHKTLQQSIEDFKASAAAMPAAQRDAAMTSARAVSAVVTSAMQDMEAGAPTKAAPAAPPPGTPGTAGTTTGPTMPVGAAVAAFGQRSPGTPPTARPTVPPPATTGAGTTTTRARVPGVSAGGAYVPPAQRVRAAIPSPTATGTTTTGGTTPGTPGAGTLGTAGHPMPVTLAPGTTLSIQFTGTCPHCNNSIKSTEVAKTVSPQAG